MATQSVGRTEQTPPPALPRGLLGLPGRLPFRVDRQPPSADLAWLVDRFWTSAWDVPAGRTVSARVLPHPNVNLTVEGELGHDVLVLTGIARGVFSRALTGRGDILGVKFTIGAFHLISDTAVPQLSPRGGPGADLLLGGRPLQQTLRDLARDGQSREVQPRARQRRAIEDYLRGLGLQRSPELELVQRAAEALLGNPEVSRVSQAAAREGVSERTLQRLFATWVGVSPGWVLRRGRLHAAAERVIQLAGSAGSIEAARLDPGLAALAADFGYADQAHFTNDFRRVLGQPPATWASNLLSELTDVTDPT